MKCHKQVLNYFFGFNLILMCGYAAINQEEISSDLLADGKHSIDNWYTTIDGEEEEIPLPAANDLSIPKCLSFRYGDADCDHVKTFYESSEERKKMQLDNIVFIMFIHNDKSVDELIKAHFDTWIRRLGIETDIIFVTDEDNERSFEEILPDADKVRSNLSIYKSPAKKEGRRLRYKVADSFQYVSKKYENDETKEYFIKIGMYWINLCST